MLLNNNVNDVALHNLRLQKTAPSLSNCEKAVLCINHCKRHDIEYILFFQLHRGGSRGEPDPIILFYLFMFGILSCIKTYILTATLWTFQLNTGIVSKTFRCDMISVAFHGVFRWWGEACGSTMWQFWNRTVEVEKVSHLLNLNSSF